MNKVLALLVVSLSLASCNKKNADGTSADGEGSKKNIPAFNDENKNLTIQQLPLKTKEDTVSYALGVAWSNGLAKVGLHNVSYAFYLGAHDNMVENTTFTTAQQAGERLDRESEYLKQQGATAMSTNKKLEDIELKSKFDTLSYQLGYVWTRGAKEYGIEKINPTLLLGLTQGLKGDTSLFTYPKADKYLRSMVEKRREAAYSGVKSKNDQWLAENKGKAGVITLKEGVQYKVIASGKGKQPAGGEVVTIHYKAKLIDNTVFENTYEAGAPLKTYPTGITPGLRAALSRMKEGDKWEIYIPYNLAYGSGGIKDKVPPFSTVIYELELLKVEQGAM